MGSLDLAKVLSDDRSLLRRGVAVLLTAARTHRMMDFLAFACAQSLDRSRSDREDGDEDREQHDGEGGDTTQALARLLELPAARPSVFARQGLAAAVE
jgi:hypothetical protein